MKRFKNIIKVKQLLEEESFRLLVLSIGVGATLFLADFGFIFAFQGYLRVIGLVPAENVNLPSFYPEGFFPSLLLFIAVGCLKVVGIMVKSYFSNVANQTFLRSKRQLLFKYAIYNAHKLNAHEVMSLNSDTLARCSSSIIDLSGVIISLSTTLFLFISGVALAPREMLLGVGLAGFVLIPIRKLSISLDHAGKGLTREWNKSNKTLLEGMRHNYFIKAHGLENQIVSKGLNSLLEYESHYRNSFIYSSFRNGLPGVWGILLVGVLTYVSINIFKTEGSILLSFLYLFIRLAQGTSELVSVLGSLQLNISSVDEVILWEEKARSFLKSKLSQEQEKSISIDSFNKVEIEARNLAFSYNGDDVLRDLSFKIDKGDIFVIRGESGVGKSTLVSLIMGLNEPRSGLILLNGSPIGGQFLDKYHDELAYVGPDPFLFEGTIKENLLFGNPRAEDIKDQKIYEILEQVKLKKFVNSLSKGLDYKFDEHTEASTGQKQRLSLCRAILREPRLLVLDEATANLDPQTEKDIIHAILPLLKNITTIVITHKGGFAEFGTKALVLKRNLQFELS